MKKPIYLSILTAALLLGGLSVFNLTYDPYANLRFASGIAEYDHFTEIDVLEERSELVVVAEFTGERELYEHKHNEKQVGSEIALSRSEVEIQKVLKGDAELKGDEVYVFEEGCIKDDVYFTSNDFKWMNDDGKYLLFLRYAPQSDSYVIVGIEQGKYDLNLPNEAPEYTNVKEAFLDPHVEFMGHDFEREDFYKLKEQAIQKYEL